MDADMVDTSGVVCRAHFVAWVTQIKAHVVLGARITRHSFHPWGLGAKACSLAV